MSSGAETRWGTGVNAEAIEAWDGPLFDRFVQLPPRRHDRARRARRGGAGARRRRSPASACSTSAAASATRRSASPRLVGPEGEAVGVDAAPRFIETAARGGRRGRASSNARFAVADVQTDAARRGLRPRLLAHGHDVLRQPGAPRCATCARRWCPAGGSRWSSGAGAIDNDWLYRAQTIVEQLVERPEEYDEPTCGPGPFSMANADTTQRHPAARRLRATSTLRRCDLPILIGRDLDEAIDLVMALGPAGEILRLAGDARARTCTARSTPRCARPGRVRPARRRRLRRPPRPGSSRATAPA